MYLGFFDILEAIFSFRTNQRDKEAEKIRTEDHSYVRLNIADRPPCPGLNALANQGYLPRDGKNITLPRLEAALMEALHMTGTIAHALASSVKPLLHEDGTFDLVDLRKHGVIEHDRSMTRLDFRQGDNYTMQPRMLEAMIDDAAGGPVTLKTLAKSYTRRKEEHKASGGQSLGLRLWFVHLLITVGYVNTEATGHPSPEQVRTFYTEERSVRPSAVLSIYLIISILFDVVQARTLWLRNDSEVVDAVFSAGLCLKMIILGAEMMGKRGSLKSPYSDYPPEALSGVLSRSVFWWINSLLIKGSATRLDLGHLYELDEKLTYGYVKSQVHDTWHHRSKASPNALLWSLLRCFWLQLITIVFFRFGLIGFKFCQPLLIRRAVSLLLEPDSQQKIDTGRSLIGATALIYLGIALTTGMFRHNTYRLITMIRGAVVGLIYDATLGLNTKAATESAALTLMSTDIERIASGFELFDCLWAGPVEIAIAVYLLYDQIQLAFLAPVIVSLLFVFVSVAMRSVSSAAQKTWLQSIEVRVATTASALSSMKGIKMTGLTECISKTLQQLRVNELKVSSTFRVVLAASTTIAAMAHVLIPFITLITYVFMMRAKEGVNLNASLTFTALSLVSLLANPIHDVAKAAPQIAAAIGCFQRIQGYIHSCDGAQDASDVKDPEDSSEENPKDHTELQNVPITLSQGSLLSIRNAHFSISPGSEPILRDINISLMENTWTILTGPIGCGKSMLLLAMLGELSMLNGSLRRRTSVETSYCAQEPWLINASIRELIQGETDCDETWFQTVLDACLLQQDLRDMPQGDQTVIGSNGLSLSGGQKQRLSLARAVYSRKPLLILDDVLGGLDAKTEQAIIDNVFAQDGLLRKHGMTAILATHSVRHAWRADHVIFMAPGGFISEQGPPSGMASLKRFMDVRDSMEEARSDHPSDGSEGAKEAGQGKGESEEQLQENDLKSDLSRQTGDMSLYAYYFKSLGWFVSLAMCVLLGGNAVFLKFPTVWVRSWSEAEMKDPGAHTNMYAGIYGLFCGLCFFSLTGWIFFLFGYGIPSSSIGLHAKLLGAVMKAPHWFFTSTDTGEILNRFSQDMSLLSLQLPFALADALYNVAICIVGAVLITLSSKWSATIYPPLLLVLYILQKFYLRTSRQIRLLDLEAKTPLYSYFLQTLQGLVTIRAYGWQLPSAKENAALLDSSQRPFYLMYSIQRWLNLVLDLVVAAIATLIVALATQLNDSSAGSLGVSLVSILTFSQDLTALIRTWTDLETSLGAIARVKNFELETPSEHLEKETLEPPAEWPAKGEIEFRNLSSAYKASSDTILKNLTFRIAPGTKVGICGRTGSGKSTFLLTLLRMAEIEGGDALIDGISLHALPRSVVRRRLATIPQEPLLLSGTVRFNADPFSEHSDTSILSALEEVGVLELVNAHGGLVAPMSSVPLSRGQQQLFCLTRAALSTSRVVLLDEITSNVDAATEAKMMEVVNKKLHGRTIIAVAHHLHTIRNFDMIIVMDQGRIVEMDSPDELLKKPSVFFELWQRQ
ncbi:ABC multidrug transporter B [Paramyrothecium foliicola]|nr:ABC multidrug transporter B [Paramyrothecium foliicola]